MKPYRLFYICIDTYNLQFTEELFYGTILVSTNWKWSPLALCIREAIMFLNLELISDPAAFSFIHCPNKFRLLDTADQSRKDRKSSGRDCFHYYLETLERSILSFFLFLFSFQTQTLLSFVFVFITLAMVLQPEWLIPLRWIGKRDSTCKQYLNNEKNSHL